MASDTVRVAVVVVIIIAGQPAKLCRRAEESHASDGSDRVIGGVAQILRREYPGCPELRGEPASHSPHLLRRQRGEDFGRIVRQAVHAVGHFLGEMVRDLRKCLRRRKSNAAWYPHPAEYLAS